MGLPSAAPGLAGHALAPGRPGGAATGAALVAAFLNAAFGYCPDRALYLLVRWVTVRAE